MRSNQTSRSTSVITSIRKHIAVQIPLGLFLTTCLGLLKLMPGSSNPNRATSKGSAFIKSPSHRDRVTLFLPPLGDNPVPACASRGGLPSLDASHWDILEADPDVRHQLSHLQNPLWLTLIPGWPRRGFFIRSENYQMSNMQLPPSGRKSSHHGHFHRYG